MLILTPVYSKVTFLSKHKEGKTTHKISPQTQYQCSMQAHGQLMHQIQSIQHNQTFQQGRTAASDQQQLPQHLQVSLHTHKYATPI